MMAYPSFLVLAGIYPENTYFLSMIAGGQDNRHSYLGTLIDITDLPTNA